MRQFKAFTGSSGKLIFEKAIDDEFFNMTLRDALKNNKITKEEEKSLLAMREGLQSDRQLANIILNQKTGWL